MADWPDGTLAEYALWPVSAVTPVDGLDSIAAEQFSIFSRCIVPYGGLVRGRLSAGETVIIKSIPGAYGTAAALVALALGAGKVVGAGRNAEKLDASAEATSGRVSSVLLTRDVAADAEALGAATAGGAELAFDMGGQANDPSSTLAALSSLRRYGQLGLMGSMTVPVPINYMQMMANNLEIVAHFMYGADAHLKLLNLLRIGRRDMSPVRATVYPMTELPTAMQAARKADSLECVVIRHDL